MDITDLDRLNAVQHKLSEVKNWVDETLRILNYVCVDEAHKRFKHRPSPPQPLSKANGLYPGQIEDRSSAEENEEEVCFT